MMDNDLKRAVLKHLAYCQASDWAGIDPYDALNSRLLPFLPFLNFKLPRLALTQALKRSPVNVRRLLLIGKTQNPKALACFLSGFLKLSRIGVASQEGYVELMIERLIALRSQGAPYWCWGYSFPWQTRTIFVPRWAPNLVCTYFVASALLDAYEQRHESRCLNMAVSAAEYILNELYWADDTSEAGFAYPLPSDRSQVHNANFLAAALLCRVYAHTGETRFLAPALKVARCTAAKQHADGSWDYEPSVKWKDNFHTGFNLLALRSIGRYVQTAEFDQCLRRGLEFYRAHFFRDDGAVKYYHDRTYPIDSHCVAQSIITLVELGSLNPDNIPLAHSVFRWAMNHLWDDRGFFYYRALRYCTIRTSYMRWTQAWMFLALSSLLSDLESAVPTVSVASSTTSLET
jgi:hypothetical protein